MITVTIDNKPIQTIEGKTVLQTALDNGIYIPNLCYIDGIEPPSASCRLCFAEINGKNLPSCSVKAEQGMTICTDTSLVRNLQKSAFELLMSVHKVDCKNCNANKKCALQEIAKFLKTGLKSKNFPLSLKEPEIDKTHPFIDYYPNKCVLCTKCIHTCAALNNQKPIVSLAGRGFDTVISFYNPLSEIPCSSCAKCIEACPTGALALRLHEKE